MHVSAGSFAGDVLAADITGTSISASWNAANETLFLSGSDTLAHYQQVLRTVTFSSSSDNPTDSYRYPSPIIVSLPEPPSRVSLPDDASAGTQLRDVEAAARAMGLQIRVLNASTSREIDAVFANFKHERPDALFVSSRPIFTNRRVQLALLAAQHSLPAIYGVREFVEVGGLMSYGTNLIDGWRQIGVYTGRILKGTKPADLPIVQAEKFELIIDHQTARILGLELPSSLLARADEVIE